MDETLLPKPRALQKEMSGRVTNAIVRFARAQGFDPGFLWEGLGIDGDLLTDVNAWVSFEIVTTMMARLRHRTGDSRIMERVGLAVPELKAFGFVGMAVFVLKEPTQAATRVVSEMFEVLTKTSTMQVLELSPHQAILTHAIRPGYPVPKDLCHFARGCIMGFPKTWGLRPAEVIEETCQAEGGSACRYDVTWPKLGVWRRLGLWIRWNRLQDRLVALLIEQNRLIEKKYEEAVRKSEELQETYFRIMASLMEALDAKDPYTRHHSRNVAAYAVEIARAGGRSETEVDQIRRAALLHDIGKIGVPEQVLLKRGPLNEEETASMRTHPEVGEKILQPLAFLGPIIQMVAQEHERYDGRGYPRGLAGEQIHRGARVIGVADAFDAMTTDRPYRKALPFTEAVAEIQRGSGTQFDPIVVEAFVRVCPRLEQLARRFQHPETPQHPPSSA